MAASQAAYFLSTGLAPFVSRSGFEKVTGPKREWWLVQSVGLLVGVVGATLGRASRREIPDEIALLGAGTAAALGGVDVVYAARGRISRVYLVDAAVQAAILAGWLRA